MTEIDCFVVDGMGVSSCIVEVLVIGFFAVDDMDISFIIVVVLGIFVVDIIDVSCLLFDGRDNAFLVVSSSDGSL